jgi:hypothetical protein
MAPPCILGEEGLCDSIYAHILAAHRTGEACQRIVTAALGDALALICGTAVIGSAITVE